ncbi:hypothetical protein [Hoeflea sp. TYP-13]|uniref:hypothetical protein n=1 Tax=Hoeflea sp. TYP-13 TaxID=3230023 RepID=UPI0034C6B08E
MQDSLIHFPHELSVKAGEPASLNPGPGLLVGFGRRFRAEFKSDKIACPFPKPMYHVALCDDQVLPEVVLAADNNVGVTAFRRLAMAPRVRR